MDNKIPGLVAVYFLCQRMELFLSLLIGLTSNIKDFPGGFGTTQAQC